MVAATKEPRHADVEEMTVFTAVEALTKGPEISLPDGYTFADKHMEFPETG